VSRDRCDLRPCALCGERRALAPRFRTGGYTIVRCEGCGLVFTNELPSRAELDEIYSPRFFDVGAKFDPEAPASPGLANARRRVARLLELPGVGVEAWLDVGCATGDFLVAARGRVRDVRGVELSRYAAELARARGLEVWTGDFLDVAVPPASFDVVTMWDYLEHVRDPGANLAKARAAVREGGYLAITTGDVDSLIARLMGRRWHLMIPPRHLYFFSPRTLAAFLERHGFGVVSVRRPGKRVPLDFAAWKAASLVAPRFAAPVARAAQRLGLGRLAPPVNLGDIMTVVARAC